ncbi:CAP domain-containing protein [Trichloromonas sp.]|uniref:CAP domain-containing protein n=1 Tax=Trichloromonas sp. TaxID=3069249 RepID=UPI002A3C4627|nr:CAP domain-containing protein [Trichloromonas sp.]
MVWARINEARVDLRATVERLGLDVEQVATSLGERAWILDAGLPPLAWSDGLMASADAHGRDMATQLYYSYQSLDGRTVADRAAEAGYAAAEVDEALAILAFSNYVELDEAVGFMVDNLLRDELLSLPAGKLTLLNPLLREAGVALFAENLQLVMGQQYVYLLVIDAAIPLDLRPWLIGQAAFGSRLFLRDEFTGFLSTLPVDDAGGFQAELPLGGSVELYELQSDGLMRYLTTVYADLGDNQFINLSDEE